MSNYFYSPDKNAFYAVALAQDYHEAGTWPVDAVQISDALYEYLMDGQTKGKVIISDNGCPVLAEPPAPTQEEIIEQAGRRKIELMKEAGEKIAPLQDALDLALATDVEKLLLIAWRKYRVEVNRIDPATAPDIVWPEQPN